jgi:hypothetical protein
MYYHLTLGLYRATETVVKFPTNKQTNKQEKARVLSAHDVSSTQMITYLQQSNMMAEYYTATSRFTR